MKVKFLSNTFEKNKRTPDIYRKDQVYDLADELAKLYIDEGKAVAVGGKIEKPAEENTDEAPKKGKKA